ncbi:mechanosensitive ion channel family protein [Nocardia aurantia]|uniref:Uncharacterized protein n=1 Tax=Nocardia aurantia TaxID=2585199 RepID=A0A7K0DSB5_9NOCA|nr:hypothetical protein [Nocardia aurantia]MQY28488.1 hypothetical protein [Nocardia aurantia]
MNTSTVAIDFQRGFTDAWSSVATFVPKLVGFLVILAIGWIIAKVVSRICDRVLRRVGFDRLAEHGGVNRMLANSRYDATSMFSKLIYYAILLITLQLGFGTFGPNPISRMFDGIVSWLPKAAVAIIIVCVAAAVARVVMDLVSNMLSGLSYGRMLGRIAAVFIWGIGIIAALNQIGVATSVTTPVLVAVLATIAGVLIVGLGGGLIRPMQQRWEHWLDTVEGEMPELRGHAEAYQRGREDAARQRQWSATPQAGYPQATTTASGYQYGDQSGYGRS